MAILEPFQGIVHQGSTLLYAGPTHCFACLARCPQYTKPYGCTVSQPGPQKHHKASEAQREGHLMHRQKAS